METNQFSLSGEVCTVPEFTLTTKNNYGILKFGLYSKTKKHNGEDREEYFRCIAFGKTAENGKIRLQKGTKVLVTGRISGRLWATPNGENKIMMDLEAKRIDLIVDDHEQQDMDFQDDVP